MKRRSLLLLSLLAFPARLFGQDPVPGRRSKTTNPRAKRVSVEDDGPTPKKAVDDNEPADTGPAPGAVDGSFPTQAGFSWKTFPIGAYTALDPNAASPQTAILDWIFRLTSPAPWHGDKVAVLCASRTQIRAYNSAKVLKQVADVVEKFVNADADVISVRVRFLAAADPRWRYSAHMRLTSIGSGPQGQQIWHSNISDVEFIIAQMQLWQGFKLLGDKKVEVLNGQTLRFERTEKKAFTGSVQRDNPVGQGFQPKVENLEEGVVLRFSPLLSYEGDTLDAAIELTSNVVRKLHPVKVLAPREVGSGEINIDVPEASGTRLDQKIKGWPIGQALIISAGIQPGILVDKGGLFNMKIPGTTPTTTELLVVINAEIAAKKPRDREN